MIIVKNISNAPVILNGLLIYPNQSERIPNLRITEHIRNLRKIGIIKVSEIDDNIVVSTEEQPKNDSKISEEKIDRTPSVDVSEIKDSIVVDSTKSKNKSNSKGEK